MKNIPVLGAVPGAYAVFNQLPSPATFEAVIDVQNSGLSILFAQTFCLQSGYVARVA